MEFLAGYLKYVLKEKKGEKKRKTFSIQVKKNTFIVIYDILSLHMFMASVSCSSGSCKKPVVS